MNYYQNYRTAELALKIRAIYINNMLSEMDVSDEISAYKPNWIDVDTDQLHMDTTMNSITLTYYIPWEDYTDDWDVPIKWIDMSDEDIKVAFLEKAKQDYEADYRRQESQFIDMAEYLGYGIFRKDLV